MNRAHVHTAAAVMACSLSGPAGAFGFAIDDDLRGAWNTLVVVGAAMRADDPDPQFVGFNNAGQYPGARGAVSVADDGNQNFRKGKLISAPVTLLSDLELRWRNQYGVFGRVRGWYDMWLQNHGVPHGHAPNGYVPGARLDDSGFYTPNQFSGFELLDAFAYGNFDIGDARLTARLGKQVINWGEGLLYTGINAFNPLNYSALGRPGARVDDALIPVNRVYANLITREGLSLEAFYALDWTRSNVPACGTFASAIDSVADPSCKAATAAAPLPDRALLGLGLYAPQRPLADPSASGQYGLAARYFVEALRTEFGAYYVRFHNPNPVVNIIPTDPSSRVGIAIGTQYVEGVQGFALSATTGLRNAALSAELSYFKDLPAQRNFPTLIQGALGQGGPYQAGAGAAPAGAVFPGYFLSDRAQLLLGGRFNLSPWTGLSDASLTAETALQWITNLPGLDQERIGRNPNLGTASYAGSCQGVFNDCGTGGFATRFSWGYRLVAQMSLPQPANGLDLQPVLLWSQDLKGYAADGSLVEGRWVAGALLRAVYQQMFFAEIGRTWIRQDTPYDPLRDKGVYVVSAGVRF